ncbi:MAG: hypothetical protein UT91_C0011G0022 [Parcubacteria group bacterium GW2011_GWA2_40_23]|nr:MAG: hypothetical protein UT91_C0011G0022 [Parcubacteria group bacterium GW2011_GWA2_40_23]
MTVFQGLIIVFILFVLYKAIRRFINKEISIWLMVFWCGFWVVLGLIAIFPIIIESIATFVGVGRGVDLIIYIALFVCFYILFKMSIKQKKNEKDIVDLVRKIALVQAKKKG